MTHSTDKILFKQTILTLEYPLLNKHDLLEKLDPESSLRQAVEKLLQNKPK